MKDLTGQTLIGNYYLESKKGSGKIAEVYKAWDNQKSTYVAVKVLRAFHENGKEFYDFFSREAELMAHLEHPNIVRFYDFCRDDSIAFIVMDWIDGPDLREIIHSQEDPLDCQFVLDVFRPICSALNYAHTKNIIHCDVKPSNILINSSSKVVLTDFGISKHISQRTTGGTPPYMAPEQFMGDKLTIQTDIYGLGITLYEMLSGGKLPYRGETNADKNTTLRNRIHWEVMNLPYPSLNQFNETISPEIDAIVRKAVEKNPAQRFRSALEMNEALERACISANENSSQTFQDFVSDYRNSSHDQSLPPGFVDLPQAPVDPGPSGSNSIPVYSQIPRSFHGPVLYASAGEWKGAYILLEGDLLTIGRYSDNLLRLRERSVSRHHALIRRRQDGIFISDLDSKLGTLVNRRKIRQMVRLSEGDVIQVGYDQIFEVLFK